MNAIRKDMIEVNLNNEMTLDRDGHKRRIHVTELIHKFKALLLYDSKLGGTGLMNNGGQVKLSIQQLEDGNAPNNGVK